MLCHTGETHAPGASTGVRINGTLYFILKGHLNSSSVVTYASETIVGEDRFYPYGETRFTTGAMYTDKLFTGQREMTGLGIYHYGARFYSQKLGRFLSPDTIVPGYTNPQAWNRYSYVLGNPLKYTDPTGHAQASDDYKCNGCTPPPPINDDNDNHNSNNGDEDECPAGSVCANDLSSDDMNDYWTDNNEIGDLWNMIGVGEAVLGGVNLLLAYLAGTKTISPESVLLIASYLTLAVLDPLPIEEILVGVGVGLIVSSILVNTAVSDLQNINDAISKTGALTGGGSIQANWDGAVVTGPAGSATVDTWIPFLAPASLAAWGILTPGITASP